MYLGNTRMYIVIDNTRSLCVCAELLQISDDRVLEDDADVGLMDDVVSDVGGGGAYSDSDGDDSSDGEGELDVSAFELPLDTEELSTEQGSQINTWEQLGPCRGPVAMAHVSTVAPWTPKAPWTSEAPWTPEAPLKRKVKFTLK